MEIGPVDLPTLVDLEIRTGGLDPDSLAQIAGAEWPRLERLHLQIGITDEGAADDVALLEPIFAGRRLPRLRHLGITNHEMLDDVCARLPTAPILPQLSRLDLSQCELSEEAARGLIDQAPAFAHLEQLVLPEEPLDPQLRAALSAAIPAICFDETYGPTHE